MVTIAVLSVYENYEKIKREMSKDEVENFLGCAPGDYTSGPLEPSYYNRMRIGYLDKRTHRAYWFGDQGTITVVFDTENDSVLQKDFWRQHRVSSFRWIGDFWDNMPNTFRRLILKRPGS